MHNNYFFIRKLAESLQKKITGYIVTGSFSQNKDELIIELACQDLHFYIRADLRSDFSCLQFPDDFSRAKKNSTDLFPQIIGKEIINVESFRFERAFVVQLSENFSLLFKLFGNFSNIVLYENDICLDIFKHNLENDHRIQLKSLNHQVRISKELFLSTGSNPRKLVPVFDMHILHYLGTKGFDNMNFEEKWDLLSKTIKMLESPSFFIYRINGKTIFLLFEFSEGELVKKMHDPIQAINFFYMEYQASYWLLEEKKKLNASLSEKLKKTESYISKTSEKLTKIKNKTNYRQIADILMANMHLVQSRLESVELLNFYSGESEVIKLNPLLNVQQNAENYYRKAKNQQLEIRKLEQNLEAKKAVAAHLEVLISSVKKFENLKELKSYAIREKLPSDKKKAITEPAKFKEVEWMDFKILIGRNARNNDELTFHEAYKEDLWLHARDVTGSHVIIKYQAGKNFPKPVIEKAAQLAAKNSKNKNAGICPVIYTEKKYVRKRKGMPPGTVIVEKEKVLLVRPED